MEKASKILPKLDGTKEKCEAGETSKGPLEELEMIPKVDEDMATAMWDAVHYKNEASNSENLMPSFSYMDASESIEYNHPKNLLNRKTLTIPCLEKGESIGNTEMYRVLSLFKPRLKKWNTSNVWAA